MDFFRVKTMLLKKFWSFFVCQYLLFWVILKNQQSDFHIFTFSKCKDDLTNRFVFITTNRSCCPLNCSSVQAKSPICRSPNCLAFSSTSSSPSAATTSMSGSKQPWAGQACQLPGLALHLYHQVVGHHPGQLVLDAQQRLGAREMSIALFQIKCSGSCEELCWVSKNPWSHGVSGPFQLSSSYGIAVRGDIVSKF